MNKRQKLISKLIKFSIKADKKDGIESPCFTTYRREWREIMKPFSNDRLINAKNAHRRYIKE